MTIFLAVAGLAVGAAATYTAGSHAPTVQAAIDLAQPGDTVVVPAGTWVEAVTVDKPLILQGEGGILEGNGAHRIITVTAPGVTLRGLKVRGTGDDLVAMDACVYFAPAAAGSVLEDSDLSQCLFGVWVDTTPSVRIEGNRIRGLGQLNPARRGNGVQLFDAQDIVVRGNDVGDVRDGIYVSATDKSLIEGNRVEGVRYGIHYMYSFDNVVRGNTTVRNSGGIALMQSSRLLVEDNVSADNLRQGIMFRDLQYCEIRRNRMERNAEGAFFFNSLDNIIVDNVLSGNEIGARVWGGTERNEVRGNRFLGNRKQVFYVAAADQAWGEGGAGGNYWSDYLGWDQDGDGWGDRPYRVDALLAGLLYRFPAAVLLMNSPALEMLARLQERMPILRVPTIIDAAPLVRREEG